MFFIDYRVHSYYRLFTETRKKNFVCNIFVKESTFLLKYLNNAGGLIKLNYFFTNIFILCIDIIAHKNGV